MNSLGEPPSGIFFTAGQAYKVVFASPTDTDPPTSPIWTVDNLKGINDITVPQSQWSGWACADILYRRPRLRWRGDQTSTFIAGLRLQITDAVNTKYATISTAVYNGSTLTTVTTVNDGSASLQSPLAAVSYGLLSSTNISIPRFIQAGNGVTVTYNSSAQPVIALQAGVVSSALSVDVLLNNTGTYFDGPSMAQGTSGTWLAIGTVVVQDTAGLANIGCKLWDGTTVFASGQVTIGAANSTAVVTLFSGLHNFSCRKHKKISCIDATSTSGKIRFNQSGNSRDGLITGTPNTMTIPIQISPIGAVYTKPQPILAPNANPILCGVDNVKSACPMLSWKDTGASQYTVQIQDGCLSGINNFTTLNRSAVIQPDGVTCEWHIAPVDLRAAIPCWSVRH